MRWGAPFGEKWGVLGCLLVRGVQTATPGSFRNLPPLPGIFVTQIRVCGELAGDKEVGFQPSQETLQSLGGMFSRVDALT